MRFTSQTFWLAKDADSPEQFQDAFELDAERGVAAIADGVSSAIFSGPWARILTRATVDDPPRFDAQPAAGKDAQPAARNTEPSVFAAWLARRRAAWVAGIDTARLTWYQRPKMVDGAMTTLLWVELWPDETGDDGLAKNYQLYSFAIGDSCLFHVRDGQWLAWFPLTGSAEFCLNPAVVRSIDRKLDHLLEFRRYDARCLPGDLLVLATDAIALWAVERQEAGDPVNWETYWDMSHDAWSDEIFALRSATRMRFDDSTLVLLRVIEETPAPPPPEQPAPTDDTGDGDGARGDGARGDGAKGDGAKGDGEREAPKEAMPEVEGIAAAPLVPDDALVSAEDEPAPERMTDEGGRMKDEG